jgi:hypothetical protein
VYFSRAVCQARYLSQTVSALAGLNMWVDCKNL